MQLRLRKNDLRIARCVCLFDAFVDSLNLERLGFAKAIPETMGRPSYDPRDLLKTYFDQTLAYLSELID